MRLPEHTKKNEHAIELKEDKQLPDSLIYNLDPVELKTLKTYIETYQKTGFIRLFKSLPRAFIFLSKSRTETYASTSIIEFSKTWLLKINNLYLWSVKH